MDPIEMHEIPVEIKDKLSITNISFPKQGCTSDVGIVEAYGNKYVLKRAKEKLYRQWLEKEAEVLQLLSGTALPVPKIHQHIVDEKNDQSWIVMNYIEGISLGEALQQSHTENDRLDLIYQYGKILKKLHETPCPIELIKQKSWLEDMLEQSQFNLDHYEVDGNQRLLDELRETKPKDYPQSFIHGDFTIDNVLVRDGKVVGIIDWSGGAYGDPRYDAALAIRPKPKAFENEEDKNVFFQGYGERIIDEWEYEYFEQGLYEFF
ncbi:Phosphotransferase enzyme family protein [Oceanobacillus limi]|uniref:Phosphotransferase enzyme family protein n=1 Tax=Oceanobacillus limi TaxID=930131 RepID=A0A1I0GD76_9BACI|nr:phosphotransferase [Oceanobacillus limi]SET68170.1 Phosphotransferase enzyme family protein [Oceanobacillus limi]